MMAVFQVMVFLKPPNMCSLQTMKHVSNNVGIILGEKIKNKIKPTVKTNKHVLCKFIKDYWHKWSKERII